MVPLENNFHVHNEIRIVPDFTFAVPVTDAEIFPKATKKPVPV